MNNKQLEDLEETLVKVLDARAPVDRETHIRHHAYIETLIEENLKKAERNEAIKKAVYIWGTIGILSATAKFVHTKWQAIVSLFGGN